MTILKMIVFLFFAEYVCGIYADNSGSAVDLSVACVRPETTRGDLAPILLMHGLLGNRRNWQGICEVLSMQTNRMVCASDARNHGLSPRTEDFSFDLMAADTIRLLDKHNVSKAILLGHSMGGKTAALTALRHPNRVEKLLVEDMRPNAIPPGALLRTNFTFQTMKNSLNAIPEGANAHQAKEAVINFIEKAFKENTDISEDERTISWLKSSLVCNDSQCRFLVDIDLALSMLDGPDLYKSLDGLYEGDTMFIYGKVSDFKIWEVEDEIKVLFPNAQLVGIDGASHGVHFDKPREYLEAVIRFINGEALTQ